MHTALSILVVDDSRSMSRIMTTMSQQLGFTDVDQADDGLAALGNLKRKNYGLIISDWEMHPMNGPQLVQALRDDPVFASIPVILVTAAGSRDDAAWLSGADGFLSKPFTPAILKDKIDEVLYRTAEVLYRTASDMKASQSR